MRAKSFFAITIFAVFILPATLSAAQDAASARAFLTSIFRLYDKSGRGVGIDGSYLNSSLVALIHTDVKATGSDVPGVLDGDLLCGCQEWDGIWIFNMDLKMETPPRAEALISFAVYAPKDRPKDDTQTIKITLAPERGQWRIYDILYPSEPGSEQWKSKNLRGRLQEEIYSYARQPKHPPNA